MCYTLRIVVGLLAIFCVNVHAVEYVPDPDVAFDIIQMHDTTTWEKVCQSYDGVCDVPEGTYQVKLLDRNWNELVRLRDVRVQRSSSQGPAGADGSDGTDGDSAYEVAVANGFSGTEIEWLESLHGPAGSDGIDGMDAQLPTYSLGATGPAGGFVFYVTNDGLHGYEAAPVDQGNAEWGCLQTDVPGVGGVRIGSGKHNTEHIVAECGNGTAAQLADAYSHNGYNDWYLPSISALWAMHNELHLMGQGGFAGNWYWSSTEFGLTADELNFNLGISDPGFKSSTNMVRAVRAF